MDYKPLQSDLRAVTPPPPYSTKDQTVTHTSPNAELIRKMRQVGSYSFLSSNRSVASQIKLMSPTEVQELLREFFDELAADGEADPIKRLDNLVSLVPLECLLNFNSNEDVIGALARAKVSCEEAQRHIEIKADNVSHPIKKEIVNIFNGIIRIIGTLASLLDVTRLANAQEQMNETQMQMRATLLIQLFTLLATLVGTYAVSIVSGPTLTAVLVGVGIFAATWKYICPKPQKIGKFTNLNYQIKYGELKTTRGNEQATRLIATALEQDRNVLIVAPSRSGKNETVYAFVKNIINGAYNDRPMLKNQTVHIINTSKYSGALKSNSEGTGASQILENISNEMGRFKDETTLVFDEFHCAFKNQSSLGDEMKTELDKRGKLPHVIAMTTDKDYDLYLKTDEANAALNRFDIIRLENPSEEETLGILGDYCIANNIGDIFAEDALRQIYATAAAKPDARFPYAAIKLLEDCLKKIERTQGSSRQQSLENLQSRRLSTLSRGSFTSTPEANTQVQHLNGQIAALQKEIKAEEPVLEKLYKARDLLTKARDEAHKTAQKVSKVAFEAINESQVSTRDKDHLKRYLMLTRFFKPQYAKHIETAAKNLKRNVLITTELVKEVGEASTPTPTELR